MTKKQKQNFFKAISKEAKKPKPFWKILNKLIFSLIIISSIFFLISVNDLSIKGFMIEDLGLKIKELKKENQNIKLETMALNSYENISQRASELHMVKVDTIDYVSPVEGAVARR